MDVLISLIQLDDLSIYDEMTLFHCLVKWVEAQEEQNENLIRQIFSYVRFPMMSPRQLADLLLCSLTQRYKEFFVERMAISMAFHSGSKNSSITLSFDYTNFHILLNLFTNNYIKTKENLFMLVLIH